MVQKSGEIEQILLVRYQELVVTKNCLHIGQQKGANFSCKVSSNLRCPKYPHGPQTNTGCTTKE